MHKLSTGDVRKCLNQIYRASLGSEDGMVDANWLLYNGMTTGQFCTMYVIDNHHKRKTRYKKENVDLKTSTVGDDTAQKS